MKVIRNINNNVCLCEDSSGKQVVAFGAGIGFVKPPHDVPLSKIDRTFYDIDKTDLSILKNIPAEIMEAAIEIIDMAQQELKVTMISSAILSLADHINFAIQRKASNTSLNMAVKQDLLHLYARQVEAAKKAIDIIYKKTGYLLPEEEIGLITLHFINSSVKEENSSTTQNSEAIIEQCVKIIEKTYDISIDKKSFNYSRFVTHMEYLFQRNISNQIDSRNKGMFDAIKNEYPLNYDCALQINGYLKYALNLDLNEEELLYLMLHINRLCSRIHLNK